MGYLIYSFCFFTIAFLLNNAKTSKVIYYWYFFSIALFWGLSLQYAVDTDGYMEYYMVDVHPLGQGTDLHVQYFEVGFNSLAVICKTISPNFVFFQFFVFACEIIVVILGLKKLFEEKYLKSIIPLLFFLYPSMLSAMRQGIAIAIFIYALHFINEKKSWRFFIWILIASLFHQSALMLIVVYFARFTKRIVSKDWVMIAVLAVCDIAWATDMSISNSFGALKDILNSNVLSMGFKFSMYIYDEEVLSNIGIAKVIEVNLTIILYTFYCKKEKQFELFRFILLITVIVEFLIGGLLAHRIMYYYEILYYCCFIRAILSFFETKIQPQQIGFVAISLYMMWFYLFKMEYIEHEYVLLF